MVKYSFSADRIVYRSFLNINLLISVSYAVGKLHAHVHTCPPIPNTEDNLAKQRDLDPCLRERQTALIELLPSAFKPFLK